MTTTGSGTGDYFEYKGVQECQKNIDTKFSELAEILKSANDYMNANIQTSASESAIKGDLGQRFLDDWNANASTFSDFYENFSSWSTLMASIIEQYGTFEIDAVSNAIGNNQSSGATLKGVAETREAQKFNEDQWRAEQAHLEMIGESCDPENMARLGWKEALIRNGTSSSASGAPVQETEDKIAKGETVYDQDGYGVNGLKLRPELCEDNNYNEFMIYEGIDHNGNKQYYAIDLDGGLHRLDPEYVSDIGTVSEHVKVGDTYSIVADGSGDNAADRIYKSSYIVGYDSKSNQTYMALPRSDGSVEYYTVEGEIHGWDHETGTNWTGKVTEIGVTPEAVAEAGFQPLYENKTFETQDVAAVQEKYSGVGGVEVSNEPTSDSNGYYKDGQFYGGAAGGTPAGTESTQGADTTPSGNAPKENDDTQGSGAPYYGTTPSGSAPKDDDDTQSSGAPYYGSTSPSATPKNYEDEERRLYTV